MMGRPRTPRLIRGFTLVELLVSMVLLTLIALMLVGIVKSTATTWRYTTGKAEQFKSASNGYESITRRISQATLNTSWDYHYPGNNRSNPPDSYVRQSDLRFIAGKTETLAGTASPHRPTHGVFFQAPLGFVDDTENFGGLDNLLNTWGYYVEFNKDTPPAFLASLPNPPPARYRYRLMELMQPANELSIYSLTANNPFYAGHEWFTAPLNASPAPVHVLAENVCALVILPKFSKLEDPTGVALSPNYAYDSAPQGGAPADPALNPQNQLPPAVQITLVAVDETSAARQARGTNPPDFGADLGGLFENASRYDADLQTLQNSLVQRRINHRVFTSTVGLRAAKWSKN